MQNKQKHTLYLIIVFFKCECVAYFIQMAMNYDACVFEREQKKFIHTIII